MHLAQSTSTGWYFQVSRNSLQLNRLLVPTFPVLDTPIRVLKWQITLVTSPPLFLAQGTQLSVFSLKNRFLLCVYATCNPFERASETKSLQKPSKTNTKTMAIQNQNPTENTGFEIWTEAYFRYRGRCITVVSCAIA